MNDRAEEDEEMPEEMGALFLHCEGNDADGVDDPADECEEEQGQVFPQHTGQEKQAAPAQYDEQCDMERLGTAGAKDGDKNDACDDDCPLDAAEDRSQLTAPEKQPHRGKGAADEEIDGNIIEPPPDPFDCGTPAEGMIQAAHEEHHDQAEPVDDRAEQACGSTGFQNQQYQAGNGEQCTDTVGDSIADFFKNGPFRRLIEFTGIFFHDSYSCKRAR